MKLENLSGLASQYSVPLEDVMFIALNHQGVCLDCSYDRMRANFHIKNLDLFSYATMRKELDYYFALPVKKDSPFHLDNGQLFLAETYLGEMSGVTEDICNSHYFRRQMTSLCQALIFPDTLSMPISANFLA